jgi:hypothetical protein
MPLLEAVVHPVSLAYFATKWNFGKDASLATQKNVLFMLETAISVCDVHNQHYLNDVVAVSAAVRCATLEVEGSSPVRTIIPTATASTPQRATDSVMASAARLVITNRSNARALAWYSFHCALVHSRKFTLLATAALPALNLERMITIIDKFGAECKFHIHGDMYLWAMTRLLVPAWLTSHISPTTSIWPAFAAYFGDTANEEGRTLVQKPPVELLELVPQEGKFVLIAGIVLELISLRSSIILVNANITKADPLVPTLYVTTDFSVAEQTTTPVFGYVVGECFYTYDCPYVAVASWLEAYTTSTGTCAAAVANARDILFRHEVAMDNPYSKYI